MDKGYALPRVYEECAERNCLPIIPLRKTGAVKQGKHLPPSCEHGTWKFGRSDRKRGASKWRCPTGECRPASTWVAADRLHPLIPRETKRWKALYRKRASGRAGVRQAEERLGIEAASRPWLDQACLRAHTRPRLYGPSPSETRKRPWTIPPGFHPKPSRSSAALISSEAASLMRVSILASRRPRSN